jgi:hypothetical protein
VRIYRAKRATDIPLSVPDGQADGSKEEEGLDRINLKKAGTDRIAQTRRRDRRAGKSKKKSKLAGSRALIRDERSGTSACIRFDPVQTFQLRSNELDSTKPVDIAAAQHR